MADLAGFDVIAEVHIQTISDLINLTPVLRKDDGSNVYLLGGPFSIDLSLPLGALAAIPMRVILNVTLQPVIHQPLARLSISMKDGSASIAGRSLNHMGGQATVSVPLILVVPPAATALSAAGQVPAFLLGATDPLVVLDSRTRADADATLGTGGADRITSGLRDALAAFLGAIGSLSIPLPAFTVVPGVNSHDPKQLSAAPIVAWIDRTTLGVFGYYHAGATGGSVAAKQTGDLGQSREEFFYGQNVLPGRRVAILLSAVAFQQVIICPGMHDQVIRSLVFERDLPGKIGEVRARDGAAILQKVTQANWLNYYLQEIQAVPNGDPQEYWNHVQKKLAADAEATIKAQASRELDAHLTTMDGQKAITDATPPPCGKGAVQIDREHVPAAQSDFVAMLRQFEIDQVNGRLVATWTGDGFLEFILGDVSPVANGIVDIFITVTDLGQLDLAVNVHPANVDVHATGLTGDVIGIFAGIFEGTWGALMTYVGLVLQSKLKDTLKNIIGTIGDQGRVTSQLPFPTRLADVKIDAESVLMLGLICHHPQGNEFNPGLLIDTSIATTPSDLPPLHGNIRFPATDWGCRPAHFETMRTFWDTTIGVTARLRDAPLPVTVLNWEMELGNFSFGVAHSVDPRPTWSNQPATISGGQLSLTGNVNHPDPPVVGILQHRTDVLANVAGDPDQRWAVGFNGADGNFYVRFAADVRDGEGTRWHGETMVTVQGDQLEMPAGYALYKADCDAKYAAWFRLQMAARGRLAQISQVQPGQAVESGEMREALAARTLVEAGDPAALGVLTAAVARFGTGVLRQVGRVAALPVGDRIASGEKLR